MLQSRSRESGKSTQFQLAEGNLTEMCKGFIPAFRDLSTDETHISTSENGDYSTQHDLSNVPIEWVEDWDDSGYALTLKPTIIAGYLRGTDFFTLFDLINIQLDS